MNQNNTQSATLLVARILMALVFIPSGMFKLIDNPQATEYMSIVGGIPFPEILSWVVGLMEVAFGLAIIVGFQTRIVAGLLALFCIATAVLFHAGVGAQSGFSEAANAELIQLHIIMLMKNFSMAGGFLVLMCWGPGKLSVDMRNSRQKLG